LRMLAEIARAVAAAHSVGIIHKDLKPSNVLMRKGTDGRWHPVLADFGIGAVADKGELERRGITVAGWTRSLLDPGSSRTGTRMYQPPESSAGRPAMMQADVYALGVLLYQMVLGDFDSPFGEGWEDELRSAWIGEGLAILAHVG
jgi:eukaryotic-like serine/threonine-protein kinase